MISKAIEVLINSLVDFPDGVQFTVEATINNDFYLILSEDGYKAMFKVNGARILNDSIYLIASVRQLLINLHTIKGIQQ